MYTNFYNTLGRYFVDPTKFYPVWTTNQHSAWIHDRFMTCNKIVYKVALKAICLLNLAWNDLVNFYLLEFNCYNVRMSTWSFPSLNCWNNLDESDETGCYCAHWKGHLSIGIDKLDVTVTYRQVVNTLLHFVSLSQIGGR